MGAMDLMIRAGQGDYPVRFVADANHIVTQAAVHANRVVVIDRRVAALYPELRRSLGTVPLIEVDASENEKTLPGVQRVLEFMQRHGSDRRTVVVAVGGGIIQDIASVAAHLYYRGLKWVFVPTTLLSMADSCIGAKSAVNLAEFKNQLGAFHAPSEVLVWLPFIETLAPRDVRSGYGEILKLHITGGPDLFDSLKADLEDDRQDLATIGRHVRQSLSVKQQVIEVDEYERDLRRVLNYGHSFGHALEAVTSHEIPHGLAVAWGIDVANYIAVRLGILSPAEDARMRGVIHRHFREPIAHAVSDRSLFDAMRRDKKSAEGSISLILPESIGRLRIVPHPLDDRLRAIIADYLDTFPLPTHGDRGTVS